ncbi:MAG: translocation/assembly module TamB domain-containing protein [Chitinophagales bacterium]
MSILRQFGNIVLLVLGVFLVLTGILSAKIDNPKFQSYAGDKIVNYLSNKLHTEIKIGSVNFRMFDHLVLHDVLVRDLNKDTLIAAQTIDVTLGLIDLLQRKYVIKKIVLDNANVFLHNPKDGEAFNYQFIVDAFSSKTPSPIETTPPKLDLGALILNRIHFVMLDEYNDIRLDFRLPDLKIDVKQLDLSTSIIAVNDITFKNADLKIAKLERFIDPNDTLSIDDTAIVHLNTKPLQFFVSSFRFVDSQFQFDDMNEPVINERFDGFHQLYKHLNVEFQNGSFVLDTIKAKINDISFTEKSGFVVNHLEGLATVTPSAAIADQLKIETPNSSINNFFSMSYKNFHAFFDYNSSVTMKAVLKEATVSLKDIAFFMPQVNALSGTVITTGSFHGPLDNLKGKDVNLQTASLSRFNGNIDIKGLPETDATFIDLKVDQLVTSAGDVTSFVKGLNLPKEFNKLGTVDFNGSFTGFLNDFVAYGVMNSKIGQLSSDLNMKFNENYSSASYSGNIAATQFDIGNYANADSLLGTISFNTKVQGTGLRIDHLDAVMNGEVQQLQFNGYNYQHLIVDGTFTKKLFTGKVKLNDENLNLDFTGLVDFNDVLPVYDFHAAINNARLNNLHITDSAYVVSSQLDMNMRGDNIDNFIGYAIAINTTFSKPGQTLNLDSVFLNINEAGGNRHFLLDADAGRATFDGKFALTKLPNAFLSMMDHYFPSLPLERESQPVLQDFDFDIKLNDVSGELRFFFPRWSGLSESIVHGHFNSFSNSIAFAGTIPSLHFQSLFIDTLAIEANTVNQQFQFNLISSDLQIGDSMSIIHPAFEAKVSGDSANLKLSGANLTGNTYMDLHALITGDTAGFTMKVLPSDLVLNAQQWNVSGDNMISYSDERLRFNQFTLSHDSQSITISNVNLRPRATNLHFDFYNLPVADLYHFVKIPDFDIDGKLSGNLEVLNVFHSPRLQANTVLSKFTVNGRNIDEAAINMGYIPEDDQITTQLLITDANYDVRVDGSYFPRKAIDKMNFNLDIRKFDLSFFETLLPGFFSNTNGSTEGLLHLSGNPENPELTGKLDIPYLTLKVDYLQTTYKTYNETVTFNANNIDIGIMKLLDANDDMASAHGQIMHDHLRDFTFNLTVNTARIQALKTTEKDNKLFYGTAEASGIIQFLGPVENMEIRASVTSMQGTDISVPINSGATIGDRSFIRYMKRSNDTLNYSAASGDLLQGLTLNFDMDITPAAKIKIIFDQKAGDIISGTGNGNIRMEIDPKGDFNMYGTYTIEQGDYLFTLQNFFNKFFTIDEGGTISWTGDPYEAQINIDAIYSTKASVYDLAVGSGIAFSDQEIKDLQRHVPVRVALKLSGSLLLPDVTFDIMLPDETALSSAAYQQVQKVKQDEGELNKQVFGLLILNRFLPTTAGSGNQSIGSDVNNSVSEFLLNQLSYWTSQIRNDIDFNFNYQSYEAKLNSTNPNDLTKRNELEVALTKRFLNDRLALEAGGNFDFAGANSTAPTNAGSTNVAGDFSVDYKITPDGRLSGKAFSKSQYDVVDEKYKTKNGVALSYKREFNKFKDLFQKDEERAKEKEERRRLKEQQEIEKKEAEVSPVTSN